MANKLLKDLTLDEITYDVPIIGVKGGQETNYRTGNVNLSIDNLAYLGTNPTGGVANDTKAFWKTLGTGYALITSNNMVNGQPAQYGILLNYSYGANMLAQYFLVTANGIMHRRGNNSVSTTSLPEFEPVNTNNTYTASDATPLMDGTATAGTSAKYAREGHVHPTDTTLAPKASPTFTGTPKAPTNTTSSTSTTQIATTAFVQNAINRRVPKANKVFYSSTTTASVPTGTTGTTWDVFTATESGTIIASALIAFAPNATGMRGFDVYHDGVGIGTGYSVAAAPTGATRLNIPVVRHISDGDKIQFKAMQTSGAALNVTSRYLMGIWIPD